MRHCDEIVAIQQSLTTMMIVLKNLFDIDINSARNSYLVWFVRFTLSSHHLLEVISELGNSSPPLDAIP